MSAGQSMNLACLECGGTHATVRLLIKLKDHCICTECVDLCHEIAHEGDTTSTIATADLEALRAKARLADLAKIWIDGVRNAVQHADGEISKGGAT